MSGKDRSVDAIIRKAMEEGAFDNLRGKGKPLKLNKNPFVEEEWQLAYDMISGQGFALPWIEKRNEIEGELTRAKEALARTWAWRGEKLEEGEDAFWVDQEWKTALRRFEEKVAEVNKKIYDYNLEIPGDVFYRRRVDVVGEVRAVKGEGD
jgi:DnaJ family protein C protein 28